MLPVPKPIRRRPWRWRTALMLCALWAQTVHAQAAPHCTNPNTNTDPTTGQINWSTIEPGCDGTNGCNGIYPDTGPDGTPFNFVIHYFSTTDQNPVLETYLFIDTNGDGTYPCDPTQVVGGIGILGGPTEPTTPWPLTAFALAALGCVWLAVRRTHAQAVRLGGAVGLALLVALGCGGGGGGKSAECAQFEAYQLAMITTTPGSLDLGRELKLCGKARTVAFIFYVTSVLGRIGGPGGQEQQINTQ
jgi:hypothetical protein